MGILSLLCFIWAGRTLLGFCLLTCTFISLISSGSGRTSNEFQPCSKPCSLCATFMRAFFFIVSLLIFSNTFGQSLPEIEQTTLTNSSDLKNKVIYQTITKIKLPDLTQCKDSLHFRFSKDGRAIDIWTNDYVTFYGRLLNFMNTHYSPVKYYCQAIQIDTNTARGIYELFLKHSIFEIPSQENIKGWITGFDGELITITHATPTFYSLKKYWSPHAYRNIKEAVAIDSINSKLYKIYTDLTQNIFFLCALPSGLYEDGELLMSCTLTKPEGKSKN
jgi:hypothetical protein